LQSGLGAVSSFIAILTTPKCEYTISNYAGGYCLTCNSYASSQAFISDLYEYESIYRGNSAISIEIYDIIVVFVAISVSDFRSEDPNLLKAVNILRELQALQFTLV
jgi:hypothetical protein